MSPNMLQPFPRRISSIILAGVSSCSDGWMKASLVLLIEANGAAKLKESLLSAVRILRAFCSTLSARRSLRQLMLRIGCVSPIIRSKGISWV